MAGHPPPSPPNEANPSEPSDLDADTIAMNALLGFSSFAPSTTKKRRFHDIDDAVTGATTHHPNLPQKPPTSSSSGANSLPILPRAPSSTGAANVATGEGAATEPKPHGTHRGGNGPRDRKGPWWTDYYDPSSNENPWERLEQARGMEAAPGGWIASPSAGGGGGGGKTGDARDGATTV